MNPDLPRLTPGIISVFESAGFTASVTEANDQIAVTVQTATGPVTKQFPYPSTNQDLSIPLVAWKLSLISGGQ